MTISKTLSLSSIRFDLRPGNVEGAIAELVDVLAAAGDVDGPHPLVEELKERERLRNAAGRDEFALLHAVTPRVERIRLLLGRSPTGLASHGAGRHTVHFVCLLLVPPAERSAGFGLLNRLAVMLRDPMVRTRLLWAETPRDALAICREVETGRWISMAAWLRERVAAALGLRGATETASGETA